MDYEWAAQKLEKFIQSTATVDELDRVGRLIAGGNEGDVMRLDADRNDAEDSVRTLEPVAQRIMDAVEPMVGTYERAEESDNWNLRWQPAKRAALRALGLARGGAEAAEHLRPTAPDLVADQLHPWVWEAARPMWEAGSDSMSVLHAAQAVNARLQQKLSRSDSSDMQLCADAFSTEEPKVGHPKLRFSGDRASETWRSQQQGAAHFGRGRFQAIRNPLAHQHQHHLSRAEALESLAALSLLAR